MWYEEDSSSAAIEAECAKLTPNSGDPATTVSPTSNAVGPKTAETPAYQFIDLPHNFYWALPGKLIGMGCPTRRRHVENLIQHHKVAMVVNLRECGTTQQLFDGLSARNVHIPVKSFGIPTIGQVQLFIRCVDEVLAPESTQDKKEKVIPEIGHANKSENNERKDCKNGGTHAFNIDAGRCNDCDMFSANLKPRSKKAKRNRGSMTMQILCKKEETGGDEEVEMMVRKRAKKKDVEEEEEEKVTPNESSAVINANVVAVNCRWGKGRTGTMICCYLVHSEGLTAHEAICRVRALSPGSLETKGQEEFVEEFYRLKFVAEGREVDYQRSLPYPFIPQHHNQRTNPAPQTVSTANATYGRHDPATSRAYAQKVASSGSGKICWNNSLLLAKMYK